MIFSINHLFIAIAALSGFVLALAVHGFFLRKRIRAIFKGESGMSLDKAMERHLARTSVLEQEMARHAEELKRIKERFTHSIQKMELMRFNSFEEAGGQQSFTLALLDGNQNGFIVTNLQSRDAARLYVKSIQNGVCAQKLSYEEDAALKKAAG